MSTIVANIYSMVLDVITATKIKHKTSLSGRLRNLVVLQIRNSLEESCKLMVHDLRAVICAAE